MEPRVFVGRIPSEVPDEQLKEYFGRYGRVQDVYRPKQAAKDGMQFAFVIFTNATDVARVLAEDRHEINGHELNVIRARPKGLPPGAPTSPASSAAPPVGRGRSGASRASMQSVATTPVRVASLASVGAPVYGAYELQYADVYRNAQGMPTFDPAAYQYNLLDAGQGYGAIAGGGQDYLAAYPVADPYAGYGAAASSLATTKHRYQPY